MWEITAFIPIVPSLNTLQHTEQLASLVFVETALSHHEYFGSSIHFGLNLHFPIYLTRLQRTHSHMNVQWPPRVIHGPVQFFFPEVQQHWDDGMIPPLKLRSINLRPLVWKFKTNLRLFKALFVKNEI